MPLRVLHLNTYRHGGAARAALALHQALASHGVDSRFVTAEGTRFQAARAADRSLLRLQRSPRHPWRSTARFSSLTAKQINESSADVVNLHWITDGFLSIEEIGKITKPLVWSMYDMWPFTGTEHYEPAPGENRPTTGYTNANRPSDESGVDLDRWTWQRKRDHWRPIHMVPASSWLEEATRTSALMREWPVSRIPHVINTDAFVPRDMTQSRERVGIEHRGPLVAFLSTGGTADSRKGWDLLEEAMGKVTDALPDARCLVVGPTAPESQAKGWPGWALPMNSVSSQDALVDIYNSANIVAVPSRQDNMPLTAMEAQACGTPVVAFATGGLHDIIEHATTGYLAQPFSTDDLAYGIITALKDQAADWNGVPLQHGHQWSPRSITARYSALYETMTP